MFASDVEPPGEDPTVMDAIFDPVGTAYLLANRPPNGSHFAAVEAIELSSLNDAACVDLLAGIESERAWLEARQQQVLAHMHRRETRADGLPDRDWLREDVACALRLAPRTAQNRIAVAVELAERLPATLRLLTAGRISYRHVLVLTDAVAGLDDDVVAAVEARVLPRSVDQTPGEFRVAVKRAVMALDPSTSEEKHILAAEERQVVARPSDNGMVDIWAHLPAPGAAVVMEAIETLASVTSAADIRTMDQRRADALVSLGSAVLHDPLAPRAQGQRPHIQVTVSAATLLGLDELPGELDGYGPIPAELARELAADPTGTWRRILTDPASGTLLDYGTTRYRPPPRLTEHIIARDQECVFPHCHRRAYRCDVDHLVRWADGGETKDTNLGPLCPRHHAAKDEHGWKVRRDDCSGTYMWISPAGHLYAKDVPNYFRRDGAALAEGAGLTNGVALTSSTPAVAESVIQCASALDQPSDLRPTKEADSDSPPF